MIDFPEISIPLAYVTGSVVPLIGTIVYFHKLVMKMLKGRLDSQDGEIMELKKEIKELSQGCGLPICRWIRPSKDL